MQPPPFFPQPEKQFQFSMGQCSIFLGFVLMGIAFKIQHYPGSALSILVASGGLAGYNFVAFLLLRGKHLANNIFLIAEAIWLLILIYGLLFNDGHPYNEYGIMIHLGAFVITGAINGLAFRKHVRNTI